LSKLGIEPEEKPFLIGFVGRVVYEKGISYLLEAIPYLSAHLGRDFRIMIVGDYQRVAGGSIKKELDVYEKKYPGRIRFTGFLSDDELCQFYSLINVLVLPSIDPLEAFGMVQIEAMCCGCPVIATDMPGVRVPIRETGFGLLVPPRDAQAIGEKICQLARHGVDGSGFSREEWSCERAANCYARCFNE
jgi:glycosyltransferase involved in cell wall biosynthesis